MDVASFGETGLLAGLRRPDGLPLPIPYGSIGAPRAADGITVVETLRTGAGTLALRGPMVPAHAFPLGTEPHPTMDALGFTDTGFTCRLERDSQTLVIDGPPAGIASVGGYRFRQSHVEAQVADVNPGATILPDAYLDARLAGSALDREAMAAQLLASGVNSLIAGAFRARKASNAA